MSFFFQKKRKEETPQLKTDNKTDLSGRMCQVFPSSSAKVVAESVKKIKQREKTCAPGWRFRPPTLLFWGFCRYLAAVNQNQTATPMTMVSYLPAPISIN